LRFWFDVLPEQHVTLEVACAREIGVVTHEDFSRQEDIKPSSDRSFGLVAEPWVSTIRSTDRSSPLLKRNA
jgi:hypothetical protein